MCKGIVEVCWIIRGQQVSHLKVNVEEPIVHRKQMKYPSKAVHPGCETQTSITVVSVAPEQGLMPSKNLERHVSCHCLQGPSRMMFSKPVIAAVEGYAVAGGMELSLMCDMRVVDENAIMGVYCRRFGEISRTVSSATEL